MANLQKTTSKKLLQTWAEDWMQSIPSTLDKAIDGPQLSTIKKTSLKELTTAIVKVLIDVANVRGGANDVTTKLRASVILEKYWYYRLQEVAWVLFRGMSGAYGMVPTGVDFILYWFESYDKERDAFCESKAMKHKEPFEKAFATHDVEEGRRLDKIAHESYARQKGYEDAKQKLQRKEDLKN